MLLERIESWRRRVEIQFRTRRGRLGYKEIRKATLIKYISCRLKFSCAEIVCPRHPSPSLSPTSLTTLLYALSLIFSCFVHPSFTSHDLIRTILCCAVSCCNCIVVMWTCFTRSQSYWALSTTLCTQILEVSCKGCASGQL